MQEPSPAIPHWAFQILYGVAWLIGGGGIVKLVTIYQNRNKPVVEVQKTEAETTEITIRSHSTASQAVMRMMDRLDEAQVNMDRIREERDHANETVEMQKVELASYDQQLKKMKAIIDISGIRMSDFDIPREKKH